MELEEVLLVVVVDLQCSRAESLVITFRSKFLSRRVSVV